MQAGKLTDNMIWLIGTGPMAIDYAKVLKALNKDFTVIGRGEHAAAVFTEKTGLNVFIGGLERFLEKNPKIPLQVINAVGIDQLANTTLLLLKYGIKNILVEKPAIAYPNEIHELVKAAENSGARVFVAYNRRFYASVLKAKEIIEQDRGVTSFHFEFTEWSHIIRTLNKTEAEWKNWFLGNSTHVIDTAFHLGGKPEKMSTYFKGSLDWHPRSSVFAGAGITKTGALFSYHANWEGPGRWGLEVLTSKNRLFFRPMETLQIQQLGTVAIHPVEVDDHLDKSYKPGLFLQTQSFINQHYTDLCDLFEQEKNIEQYYLGMSNYADERV